MGERYIVELTHEERERLEALTRSGSKRVRDVKRAQILLAADKDIPDGRIAAAVRVGTATVYRAKRRFVEGGVDHAIHDNPRPGAGRKLTDKQEALLIATACSKPPEGRARWTLKLLVGRYVSLTEHDNISRETVRRRLAENELKPWQRKMWCVPSVDARYVARMENVLDLYAEQPPPGQPVVCFDESPTQLIREVRQPRAASPGVPAYVDYEYARTGPQTSSSSSTLMSPGDT